MINFLMKHKIKSLTLFVLIITGAIALNSCTGLPKGIDVVKGVDQKKYLGKWYEIARLDHSFERGLSNVSAEYSLREDGGIKVLNRGYNADKQKWKQAEGKAYFVKDPTVGHLKVSFFGPFYGSYVIFDLDKQGYQYSYVTSYNREYLWFLSRKPIITEQEKQRFVKRAKELGFNTDELIFVDQKKNSK